MSNEEIRIGVYVCRWGINIAGVLDTTEESGLVKFAKTLPNVAYSTENISFWTTAGAVLIKDTIKQHDLNRIVVAAWTPKTHEPVFQAILKEIGLPTTYLEFCNLREHIAQVHMNEKPKAQVKAEDAIRASVARAILLEDIPIETYPVENKAMVIGGGIGGCRAALDLAEQGYEVFLVEKEPTIGGKMAMLDRTYPTDDCSIWILGPVMLDVQRAENIHLLTYAEVREVTGFVGNFEVKVELKARYTTNKCIGWGACEDVCPAYAAAEFDQNLGTRTAIYISFAQAVPLVAQIDMSKCIKCGLCVGACELNAIDFDQKPEMVNFKVGTIIVATGWDEFRPNDGYLGYGVYDNVITQLELERILAPNGPTFGHLIRPSDGKHPKKLLFVQCVGSRDLKRNIHCSSGVCCMTSIKNTKLIKQHDPETDITVAFIDIRAAGKGYEEYYLESRKYGVKYVKAAIPRLKEDKKTGNLKVLIRDMLVDNPIMEEQEFDLVVLSSAMQPANGIKVLNDVLKLEVSPSGFFKEFHSRLNTVDTSVAGISLAGAAHGPKSIAETIMQSKGAASSSSMIMQPGAYSMLMIKALVDDVRCSSCGLCVEACPYGAITMDSKFAFVDKIKCRGCGICSMSCPSGAISVRNAHDPQFKALIDNLLFNEAE